MSCGSKKLGVGVKEFDFSSEFSFSLQKLSSLSFFLFFDSSSEKNFFFNFEFEEILVCNTFDELFESVLFKYSDKKGGRPKIEYFWDGGRIGGEGGLRDENSLGTLACWRII